MKKGKVAFNTLKNAYHILSAENPPMNKTVVPLRS